MKFTAIRLPEQVLDDIDTLVEKKRYGSRSDLIRQAIRELLRTEQAVVVVEDRINILEEAA